MKKHKILILMLVLFGILGVYHVGYELLVKGLEGVFNCIGTLVTGSVTKETVKPFLMLLGFSVLRLLLVKIAAAFWVAIIQILITLRPEDREIVKSLRSFFSKLKGVYKRLTKSAYL